jgi:bifunctional UDP-N-acetylglucosamine pyrophosphorylase/glucosamine-1-phosphate N-acetyltransferase
MKAIVLAAGAGTRLKPITNNIPKAMILINGKPMLQILLEQLKTAGINEMVIIVHYMKDKIIDYFGDGSKFGVRISYAEQKEMLGTADAVSYAEPYITEEKFLLVYCDSLFETDLLKRLMSHENADGVFTCRAVEDPRRFGVILTAGKKITKFIEKPETPISNLASFSIFVMPKEIFEACKKIPKGPKGEYWITDAIQLMIDDGMIFEYEISEYVLDIGTLEQYKEAQDLAKELNL